MFKFIDTLPRWVKALIIVSVDTTLIPVALYAALVLRLNNIWPVDYILRSAPLLAFLIVIFPIMFFVFQLHRIKLSAFDMTAIIKTGLCVFALGLTGFSVNIIFGLGAPRTVPVIFMVAFIMMVMSVRLLAISAIRYFILNPSDQVPVAIFGAGQAGVQLISALRGTREYKPVFLVDDNRSLHGLVIEGLKVSAPEVLKLEVNREKFKEILLAIPSLTTARRQQVLALLSELDCEIKELPNLSDVIQSGNVLGSLRQVSPEEVLGRPRVNLANENVQKVIENRNVLVTGAGGSIGSEICRQIVANGAKRIVLLESSEIALYKIEAELAGLENPSIEPEIVPLLGSVTDAAKLDEIIPKYEVDVIYHAAAYKHVPLVESNEIEGARNNVLGTKIVAEAAAKHEVDRFTLISTDKAVNPTNVMGATKRLAEHIVQDVQSKTNHTIFSMVRFGNVLGSSGSVVPLFKDQIARGGPITLTHEDVTRYFMTIPEASSLVLLAGAKAEGGEVFVLDMGEPIKIRDLAIRLVELSGLKVKNKDNPDGDIEIVVTGLRSGEKLYEELLISTETLPTPHSKIFCAREQKIDSEQVDELVAKLNKAISASDPNLVRECFEKWVEGYHKP